MSATVCTIVCIANNHAAGFYADGDKQYDFHPEGLQRYMMPAVQNSGQLEQVLHLIGNLVRRIGVLEEGTGRVYPNERIMEVLLHRLARLEGRRGLQMETTLPPTGLIQRASRNNLSEFANLVADPGIPVIEALRKLEAATALQPLDGSTSVSPARSTHGASVHTSAPVEKTPARAIAVVPSLVPGLPRRPAEPLSARLKKFPANSAARHLPNDDRNGDVEMKTAE